VAGRASVATVSAMNEIDRMGGSPVEDMTSIFR
jgi:hypothetical protein